MSTDVLSPVSSSALRRLNMQPRAVVRVARALLPDVVTFHQDDDDLDAFEVAALCAEPQMDNLENFRTTLWLKQMETLTSARIQTSLAFLLLRYKREPPDQLTVFLPGDVDTQSDVHSAIWRIVAALRLPSGSPVTILPMRPTGSTDRTKARRT